MGLVLYCEETPNLKLGPGRPGDPDCIVFHDGYADVPSEQVAQAMKWALAPGSPNIIIIDTSAGEVPANAPDAVVCPRCGKGFDTQKRLNGHLLSHRR